MMLYDSFWKVFQRKTFRKRKGIVENLIFYQQCSRCRKLMQRVVQVLLNMRNAANQNVFQKHPINRIDHWFSEVCLQIWLQSRLKSNSLFEFWFLGRDLSFNDFAIFSTSGEIYELQFQVWGSKFELWKLWFLHCFTIFHLR